MTESKPSSNGAPVVFIGRDSRDNWVAQESCGLFGGLFTNRIDAVRYALFENGHHPEAIIELPEFVIELDITGRFASDARVKIWRRA
jgi:hypothetical protein